MQGDVLWVAGDFEIILERVGGFDVSSGDDRLESLSVGLHGNRFKAFALVHVAVIEADGLGGFFEGQFNVERFTLAQGGWWHVMGGDCGALRSASDFLNQRFHVRNFFVAGVSGFFFHGGDIAIDQRQAVGPMAAQLRQFADGDVGHVSIAASIREFSPGVARPAIGFDGFGQRGRISALVKQSVEDAGAKLRAEKSAETDLNFQIDNQAAEFRHGFVAGFAFEFGKIFCRCCGVIFEPLGDFDGCVFAAAFALEQFTRVIVDARKQLGIERADIAENLGRGRVAVTVAQVQINDRLIDIHLRPVIIIGGGGQMRGGDNGENAAGVRESEFR
jgi:hypothetical protein